MNARQVELGVLRLMILDGGGHELRAANIARLLGSHLRELLEREMQDLGADVTLTHLNVPPVEVSLDSMDDEAVARAGAEAIRRAVLAAM